MTFTNGDFETGDLTGWADEGVVYGSNCTQSSVINTASKKTGTYGCVQAATANDGSTSAYAIISQNLPSDFATVSFWYKVPHLSVGTAMPRIGSAEVMVWINVLDEYENPSDYYLLDVYNYDNSLIEGDWIEVTFDRATLEGLGVHFDTTITLHVGIKARVDEAG
jgi:hypothetical protein